MDKRVLKSIEDWADELRPLLNTQLPRYYMISYLCDNYSIPFLEKHAILNGVFKIYIAEQEGGLSEQTNNNINRRK